MARQPNRARPAFRCDSLITGFSDSDHRDVGTSASIAHGAWPAWRSPRAANRAGIVSTSKSSGSLLLGGGDPSGPAADLQLERAGHQKAVMTVAPWRANPLIAASSAPASSSVTVAPTRRAGSSRPAAISASSAG